MNRFYLAPSDIHGIGVFTIEEIEKDTELDMLGDDVVVIPWEGTFLFKKYCVRDGDNSYCSKNFNKMSIGWYMNHKDDPNLLHEEGKFYAARDILKDEELTVNYNTMVPFFRARH